MSYRHEVERVDGSIVGRVIFSSGGECIYDLVGSTWRSRGNGMASISSHSQIILNIRRMILEDEESGTGPHERFAGLAWPI